MSSQLLHGGNMKLFLKFGLAILWSIILAFYVPGCVNVDDANVSTVDLRTQIRFVNLANTGSLMDVAVDGSAVATVDYSLGSAYMSLPAGTRSFAFTYGSALDTMHRAIDPNIQCTFYAVFESANGDASRSYLLVNERQTYAGTVATIPGHAIVRFINFSNDTSTTGPDGAEFHLTYVTPDTVEHDTSMSALTFKSATPYYDVALSDGPQYHILSSRGDTVNAAGSLTTEGRFSIVLFGSRTASTMQVKVFTED
jgi:hypothetical protein